MLNLPEMLRFSAPLKPKFLACRDGLKQISQNELLEWVTSKIGT